MNKIANVTLAFWIIKICATTVGETGGDLLSMTLNVGYAVSSLILISFFIVTLVAQMKIDRFHPYLYWSVILSTSTAGTTMSDFLDRTAGLGYVEGASLLCTLLVAVLLVWRFTLGSIAVDHISQPKAEMFYWTAILVSNTLGTALGDFLADSSGLGYGMSNLLITSCIAAIALAYFFTKIPRTALFWAAFVLTRPFGATMGDLLTKTPHQGGLGFGTLGSSIVLLAVMAGLIVYDKKRQPKTG
ncbi:MAG: hypothetical protein GC185_13405 [Alphaproteobacteria bacterium]|nr:hypothetical protein [Alphaproteobacteria bacterium]